MPITKSQINDLKTAAAQAAKNAYCPYSGFHVGAAILIESGRIITGCNVENASYSLTICAERNAVFQAVTQHGQCKILAIAIYTPTDAPAAPCGACRQVINEFNPKAEVFCFCDSDKTIHTTITELLPNAFSQKDLQ